MRGFEMMKQMMEKCCGPDGRPDFDKMSEFMEQQDRASVFDAIGWALFLSGSVSPGLWKSVSVTACWVSAY